MLSVTENKINLSLAEKKNRNAPGSEAAVRGPWNLSRKAVSGRQESVSYRVTGAKSAPSKSWTLASLCA